MTRSDKSSGNTTNKGKRAKKENDNNVTGIKNIKPSAATIRYEAIMNVINIMTQNPDVFGVKLAVIENEDRSRFTVLIDDKNVCRVITEKTLLGMITKYLMTGWNGVSGRFTLKACDASEVMLGYMWIGEAAHFETVKPVGQFGKTELCWARLEWTLRKGDTPTFDELFGRMSDPEVVKAWIGSLFHHNSDRSQYLWIVSEGGDGKSSLSEVIVKALGVGATSSTIPRDSDQFWASTLVGKRFVTFPDAGKVKFVTSDVFKSYTGDSYQRVEYKGQTPVMMKLVPKFMFLSNKSPEIGRSQADKRRAIIVELDKSVTYMSTNKYNELLWNEAKHFLHDCLETYNRLSPEHEKLPVNEAVAGVVESLIEDGEESYDVIYDRHFKDLREHIAGCKNEVEAGGKKWDFQAFCVKNGFYVEAKIMASVYKEEYLKTRGEQKDYGIYLHRKYQTAKKIVRINGVSTKVYLGIQVHL